MQRSENTVLGEEVRPSDIEFAAWRHAVRTLVDENVGREINWYDLHIKAPWLWFRVSGALVIILSISLPVIASSDLTGLPISKNALLSVVSLAVALLSGLGTFFHWHDTWRENRKAKIELRNLLATWELRLLAADQLSEHTERVEAVVEATARLFEAAAKVTSVNTENYFKSVEPPSPKR